MKSIGISYRDETQCVAAVFLASSGLTIHFAKL